MIALPFAIFIGASNTYNNMAQSKELYILSAGYSNLKILKPAMISGIIAMFFSLIMQTTTGPLTWSRLQDIIYYSNNNSFYQIHLDHQLLIQLMEKRQHL